MITVVLGPPCGGKSTYVADNAKPGDVIIDYDVIAQAFGSPTPHDAPKAIQQVTFPARTSAINQVINGLDADSWIIHTSPPAEQLDRYKKAGAVIKIIDPGKEACLERAAAESRPERTVAAIERWYSTADNAKSSRSTMLTKDVATIEVKAGPIDGLTEGQFTAYASVFGNVDSYGDIVTKGAFANDLARWEKSGAVIPLLFGHNMSDPDFNIGHVVKAEEDEVGLKVTAQLDLENPKAKQVYRMLKGRRINQMSFAYDVVDGSTETIDGQDVYEIRDMKLYEVSVVTVGANQETEVLAVKQVPVVADRLLTDVKAGRVLSAKNENELRNAHQALGRVLSVLDGTPDEEKASESGPSCQVNDGASTKSEQDSVEVPEESPREANPAPSVNYSAITDAMLGQIMAEVA
jgi:hypothetical protein